jgi:hypothetical protein
VVRYRNLAAAVKQLTLLGRHLTLVGEIDLILANGFGSELVGRGMEILGELGDIVNVVALGFQRKPANLHVFDHAFSKRGHLESPQEWIGRGCDPRSFPR